MTDLSDLVIVKVVSSYIGTSRCGAVGRQLDRPHWCLILKLRGQTVYRFREKAVQSDASHPILISAGCSYEWECTDAGEFLVINFDCTTREGTLQSLFLADADEVLRQFRRIERASMAKDAVAELAKKRALYSILMHLAADRAKEYQPKSKADALLPALRYMAEHYTEGAIPNDTLASLCGMGTVSFRKKFTVLYGLSPQRYWQRFRMEKAKDMLSGEHGSLSEVADCLGFGSIYHFSKAFKEQVGLSPTEYIKRRQEEKTQ